MSGATSFETILTEQRGQVGLVTLNRPRALNALNTQVMADVVAAFGSFDCDPGVGCIVLTGSEKALAVGADIKEMQSRCYTDMYEADWFAGWDAICRVRTPTIAAVSEFALGGGCKFGVRGK